MILVDTCVISEVQHARGDPRVKAAFAALSPEQVFFSVITVGELTAGIATLEGARRQTLQDWLDGLRTGFADRILGIDAATAQLWGELTAARRQAGKTLPASDGLIAATARQHGLSVMTRNVRDFEGCGVELVNPWEGA
jgi:hypothetical protein